MIAQWIIIQGFIPSTAEISERNSLAYLQQIRPDKHNNPDNINKVLQVLWIKMRQKKCQPSILLLGLDRRSVSYYTFHRCHSLHLQTFSLIQN